EAEPESDEQPVVSPEQHRERAFQPLCRLLDAHKGSAALTLYQRTLQLCESWELPEKQLLQFAELLCGEKRWSDAVPLLEDYLQRFQKRQVPVRLRLAQILVDQQRRPTYASRVLADLPQGGLGPKEEKLRAALQQKAQKLIDDGVLELEGRAW